MTSMPPPIVIDSGSGFTKLGYSGNSEPHFIIPTALCVRETSKKTNKSCIDDLDFWIGLTEKPGYSLRNPIRHGIVEDWDLMERYLSRCIFKYLKCEPEDHLFLMTQSPVSGPEARENLAEIMFETFNVGGLFIVDQAVLSLLASWLPADNCEQRTGSYTGTVVDCGDGLTNVIPIVEGFVIGSCIKKMPISGRDITFFVQSLIRERESNNVPPEQSLETAKTIKESLCYVCPDLVTEFARYDTDPEKYIKKFTGINSINGQAFTFDVGYERFLAPDIYFHPEFVNAEYMTSLSSVVDNVIQSCPIDNIVLSGGSTLFKDFGKRLRRDLQIIVNRRQNDTVSKNCADVKVISHPMQKFAAWFGGSLYANTPTFHKVCYTKADYDEYGPLICRRNNAFEMI